MDITELEFNRLCAEFMELVSCGHRADGVEEFENDKGGSQSFTPYSDANDRNRVIEKMLKGGLICSMNYAPFSKLFSLNNCFDKSMEAAQIACIEKVLENGSE